MTTGSNGATELSEYAPTLRPSMRDFRNGDIIEFARSARDLLARYGAVRIDPPLEWEWPQNGPLDKVLQQIPDTMFSTVVPEMTGGPHDEASRVHEFRMRCTLLELAQIRKSCATENATGDDIEQHFSTFRAAMDIPAKDSTSEQPAHAPPMILSQAGPLTAVLEQRGNSLLHLFELRSGTMPALAALGQSKVQIEPKAFDTGWKADPNGLLFFSFHHGGPRKLWHIAPAPAEPVGAMNFNSLAKMSWADATGDRKVYKIIQKAGTFVVVAPWARYTSFAGGLSTVEHVFVATPDWITMARKLCNLRKTEKVPLDVPSDAVIWKFARRKATTPGFNPESATSVALGEEIKSMVQVDRELRKLLVDNLGAREIMGKDISKVELKLIGSAGPTCKSCKYCPFLSCAICRECHNGALCLTCSNSNRALICKSNEHQLYIIRRFNDTEIEMVSLLLEKAKAPPSSTLQAPILPAKRKSTGSYDPFGE